MMRIRYDIIPQGGGWSIAMGGAVGPPYSDLEDAVRDTEDVASVLVASGDEVSIIVWRGGKPLVLETLEPWMDKRPRSAG
ncbi:MAG: hypothetical protein ABIQ30_04905 [Devosia sp.]